MALGKDGRQHGSEIDSEIVEENSIIINCGIILTRC